MVKINKRMDKKYGRFIINNTFLCYSKPNEGNEELRASEASEVPIIHFAHNLVENRRKLNL